MDTNQDAINQPRILIVGQGIAGTTAAWECLHRGWDVHIIDQRSSTSASAVSSGLINPITGRHFVKSWMIDDFCRQAVRTYTAIGEHIGESIIHEQSIVRHLKSITAENDWGARSSMEGYQEHMVDGPHVNELADAIHKANAYGTVRGGYRVNAAVLINALRSEWTNRGMISEAWFDVGQLEVNDHGITYDSQEYTHLIVACGWRGVGVLFPTDVYRPVKGEVLVVCIPNFPEEQIIKFEKFIVPLGDDLFWIGSTYEWTFEDENSNPEKSEELVQFLNTTIKLPYTIVERRAGVRPSTKYRRPLIGRHPKHLSMYLFNGLGTKGVSMAPYWAKKICDDIAAPAESNALSEAFDRAFL